MYQDGSFAEGYAIGRDGSNNDWGGNGAWWIIILIVLFGYGGYGFGNRGQGSVADGYTLASDFATIQRQLSDGFGDLTAQSRYIQNGICDGFYAMNSGMLTGFNNIDKTVMQNGYETRNAIAGLSSQLSNCCCETNRNIDSVNYNMSRNTCDIIQANNANTQRIIDYLTNDKIETLNRELTLAQNQLSQVAQTSAINNSINNVVNELRPIAKPAYITCSPYQSTYGFPSGCANCGV
mgnify:CR=1 FL=1